MDKVAYEKYMAAFTDHVMQIDELAQVVLKGHLLIESALDNILTLMVFYPKHLESARLSFHQKMNIARSLCLRKESFQIWAVIAAVNALRNALAHELEGETRVKRMAQLRQLYVLELDGADTKQTKEMPDSQLAVMACGMSVGFLAEFEADTRFLRGHIDELDAALNPGLERVVPR
jgi:hypothetical protein